MSQTSSRKKRSKKSTVVYEEVDEFVDKYSSIPLQSFVEVKHFLEREILSTGYVLFHILTPSTNGSTASG